MKNYSEWINEKSSSPHPMMMEFINELKAAEHGGLISSTWSGALEFEDWWCTAEEDYFMSYFQSIWNSGTGPIPLKSVELAENEEHIQRKLRPEIRNNSRYYLLEFKLTDDSMSIYRLIGIDTKTMDIYCQDDLKNETDSTIKPIFDKILAIHFPTIHKGKLFGI